jgi:mono/diheme cytochrome c family protein
MTRKSLCTLSLAATLFVGTVVASDAGRAQDTSGGGATHVEMSNEGKEVYETICQACHMADAKGGGDAGAAIPALAGNAHLADKDFIVEILIKGRGGMPWFTDMLSQKQMAAVATYVRGHFNAYPDPVTEEDVKRVTAGSKPSPRDCATC